MVPSYDHNQYAIVQGDRKDAGSIKELGTHPQKSHLRQHGRDPCFTCFARFANEANMLKVSEAQDFIPLPIFLAELAGTQLCTSLSGASRHGGITSWPEAVYHLLRTYATTSAMSEVLENLRNIRQDEIEVVVEY